MGEKMFGWDAVQERGGLPHGLNYSCSMRHGYSLILTEPSIIARMTHTKTEAGARRGLDISKGFHAIHDMMDEAERLEPIIESACLDNARSLHHLNFLHYLYGGGFRRDKYLREQREEQELWDSFGTSTHAFLVGTPYDDTYSTGFRIDRIFWSEGSAKHYAPNAPVITAIPKAENLRHLEGKRIIWRQEARRF